MIPKFKAWDKESQTMYEVKSIIYTLGSMLCVNREALFPERILYFEDAPVMQSTGRFDKNGKEIFEGDVISVIGELHTVFYDTKKGSFRLNPHDKRWTVDYMSNYAHIDSFEIIGNIYENPELVEDFE